MSAEESRTVTKKELAEEIINIINDTDDIESLVAIYNLIGQGGASEIDENCAEIE